MTPDDLIKAAPVIAKGAAAVAAALPFTAIVKRMLGPAADELAQELALEVRRYRFGRQLRCFQKAEKMAIDAGFTPQAVPIKLLFPLLDGVSLEENEDLHTMWAALLANAASPNGAEIIRPGFIAILRQMAPDEAVILNFIFDEANKPGPRGSRHDPNFSRLHEVYAGLQRPSQFGTGTDLMVCLSSLEADKLIQNDATNNAYYALTFRGGAFVTSCRPPQPPK